MMDDVALGAYTGGSMGDAMTAIELAAQVKEQYDESWIKSCLSLTRLLGINQAYLPF